MRISTLALAIGLGFAAPVMLPTAAMAQTNAVLPAAEQTIVDAAIDAVIADTTLTPAQITQRVAAIVQNSSNPVAAARRVSAKIAGATDTQVAALGGALQQVVANIQSNDPTTAADIQVVVALSTSTQFQVGFVNGPTTPNTPQTGTPQTGNTTPVVRRPVVRRPFVPRPPIPTEPVVPIVPEPNPVQAIDPIIIVNPVNGSGGSPT